MNELLKVKKLFRIFLQNIVSNFDKEQSGYGIISQALDSMTNMAQHINEMKRKHEHAVRIQEIQSQLSDWDGADLTTYGDLVLEVWITVREIICYRQ